jgi:hypothetical protein
VPRRKVSATEAWLRARRRKTDVRERVALLLRGPALGVPLWVPKPLWPCSACLRLRRRCHFKGTPDLRVEPICDDCRKEPRMIAEAIPIEHRIDASLKRGGRILTIMPSCRQLQRIIEAIAAGGEDVTIGMMQEANVEALGDLPIFLADFHQYVDRDWVLSSIASDYLRFRVPPCLIQLFSERSFGSPGRIFDIFFDLRANE